MGVKSFTDLLERLSDIWRYCTNDWIRICIPGSGSNQSRWQCKDYWLVVQDSFSLFGQAYGVLRYKAKDVKYEHLIKQIVGCSVSACAIKANDCSSEQAIGNYIEALRRIFKSDSFNIQVKERQAKESNMNNPSNHLVQAIIEKQGGKIIGIEDINRD